MTRYVLEELQPFHWSSEESVAYEAALEAIGEAIGAYTAVIADERAKPVPDRHRIDAWLQARQGCAQRRQHLDPTNHEDIQQVRRYYSTLARNTGPSK